jgi:hypothetical protein
MEFFTKISRIKLKSCLNLENWILVEDIRTFMILISAALFSIHFFRKLYILQDIIRYVTEPDSSYNTAPHGWNLHIGLLRPQYIQS